MAAVRSREDKREDILAVLTRDYADLFGLIISDPRKPASFTACSAARMFLLRNACRLLDSCSATGDRASLYEFVLEHVDEVLQRRRGLRGSFPNPAEETSDEAWIAT